MKITSVRPIPDGRGVGFSSFEPIPDLVGYCEKHVGRYFNYLFTPNNYRWPAKFIDIEPPQIIDGFSPNLNKELHVGHLRNLALANSFSKMLPNYRFIALLGTCLGVYTKSVKDLQGWFKFINYHPEIHYDALMPWDEELVSREPGTDKFAGCQVKPGTDIVLFRSDGRPTYAFHDLALAATVAPDYYITGVEQTEHFKMLGLGEKHLPMGLVCGLDNKKLKSRTGDALSAADTMEMIKARLRDTPHPNEVAWNVLAWNFLHVNRTQNVRFDPDHWTSPDAPGMYITYTYARLRSALRDLMVVTPNLFIPDLTEIDLEVLGYSEYANYWQARTLELMDVAPFANYVHDFARVLGNVYQKERIKDGRLAFRAAIINATDKLQWCMRRLGMFQPEEV